MPAAGYHASGHRLATEGYAGPPAEASAGGLSRRPSVAFRSKSMARSMVASGRHVLDSRRVAPAIVEVEKRTNRDGIVDRLVRPSCASNLLHILQANAVGLPVNLFQELEERLLHLGYGR